MSDEAMLAKLESVLAQKGYLSGIIIDEMEDLPSSGAYASRFGGLFRVYAWWDPSRIVTIAYRK